MVARLVACPPAPAPAVLASLPEAAGALSLRPDGLAGHLPGQPRLAIGLEAASPRLAFLTRGDGALSTA